MNFSFLVRAENLDHLTGNHGNTNKQKDVLGLRSVTELVPADGLLQALRLGLILLQLSEDVVLVLVCSIG